MDHDSFLMFGPRKCAMWKGWTIISFCFDLFEYIAGIALTLLILL